MAVSTQVMDFFTDAPTFLESKTKNNPNASDSKTQIGIKRPSPDHKRTTPWV